MGQSAHDRLSTRTAQIPCCPERTGFGFDGEGQCLDLKRGSLRERPDMYRLLRATGSFLSRYLNRQTLGAYPHPAADLAPRTPKRSRSMTPPSPRMQARKATLSRTQDHAKAERQICSEARLASSRDCERKLTIY